MKKIALLFSHKLTPNQKEDIDKRLNAKDIYNLPKNLQQLWSQVPTQQDLDFNHYLADIQNFLKENLSQNDFVLIQGDFGATYSMINFCKREGFIPIYSVNKRIAKETIEDGIVKKYAEFKHEFFREYK